MKSGKEKERVVKVNFTLRDYENAHSTKNCKGAFTVAITSNFPFPVDNIGPVMLPFVPTIHCMDCGAAFVVPGFRNFIEGQIARQLVCVSAMLNKRQVRFLRLFFDRTQDQVAQAIGLHGGRHYYNKLESLKSEQALDVDKQIRLKTYYARLLGIEDSSIVYAINELSIDSPTAEVDTSSIVRKADAERFLKSA